MLSVLVGTDGRTHDIRVERSLGMGLDENAIEAVKGWTFEPATKDGKPTPVRVHVTITFQLKK